MAGWRYWTKRYRYREKFDINGTVSQDLMWALLYTKRKLFSRAIVAHHKILILLKGHFTINTQSTKEDPASERPYTSRWSAQFRCGSFRCDRIILDDAIIRMDKHARIS